MKRFFGIMAVLTIAAVASAAAPGDSASKKGGDDTPAKMVVRDKLNIDGCTFTLRGDKYKYGRDEKPVLTVEMANTTDKPVSTQVWVKMIATPEIPPAGKRTPLEESLALRSSPMFLTLWAESCTVKLAPGESETATLKKTSAVPEEFAEKSHVYFRLSKEKPTVFFIRRAKKTSPLEPGGTPLPTIPAPSAGKKSPTE